MSQPIYIRLEDDLVEWIDQQAAECEPQVSRSAFAAYCIGQYKQYKGLVEKMKSDAKKS